MNTRMKNAASIIIVLSLLLTLFSGCSSARTKECAITLPAETETEEGKLPAESAPEIGENCLSPVSSPEGKEAEQTQAPETPENMPEADKERSSDTFTILKESYPRVDGSTVTIPLSEAIYSKLTGCSADQAKLDIRHNTTHYAYENLINGDCDLIFVTGPSEDELEMAKKMRKELEIIPVVSEAFVFLVSKDNEVESLTHEQIVGIYSGEIKNWSELGGADVPIKAYQRPENSGSQTGMIELVMGDTPLAEAPTELKPYEMGALVDVVAQYDDTPDAIGYSYYYYVNDMWGYNNTRLLAVDGVFPDNKSIADGSYRYHTSYYAVIDKKEPEDSPARQLINWLLSEEGQKLAEDTGYVRADGGQEASVSDSKPQESGSGKERVLGASKEPCAPLYYGFTNPVNFISNGYNTTASTNRGESVRYYTISGLRDAAVEKAINDRITEVYSEATQWNIPAYRGSADANPWDYQTGEKSFHLYEQFNYNDHLSFRGSAYIRSTRRDAAFYSDCRTLTFDLRTGKELKLKDLFAEGYDFEKVINDRIVRYLDDIDEYYPMYKLAAPFDGIREDQKFYLTDQSLVVVLDYNNGELWLPRNTAEEVSLDYGLFGDKLAISRECDPSIYTQKGPFTLHLISDNESMVRKKTRISDVSEGIDYDERMNYSAGVPEELVELVSRRMKEIMPFYLKSFTDMDKDDFYYSFCGIGGVYIYCIGPYYTARCIPGDGEFWGEYVDEPLCSYYVFDHDLNPVTAESIFEEGFDYRSFLSEKFRENMEKDAKYYYSEIIADGLDYKSLAGECDIYLYNDSVMFYGKSPVTLYNPEYDVYFKSYPYCELKFTDPEAAALRL